MAAVEAVAVCSDATGPSKLTTQTLGQSPRQSYYPKGQINLD
jgi:hypothetical protein